MNRDDINYLLTANLDEFDLESTIEAKNALYEAVDDIRFQLKVPKSQFKGDDYFKWRVGANYKLTKIKGAARKFNARMIKLQEESALGLLKRFLGGDDITEEAKKLLGV